MTYFLPQSNPRVGMMQRQGPDLPLSISPARYNRRFIFRKMDEGE
jgi:hypothetical protein